METISGRPSPPVPRKKQILREVHDYFFVAIGILMYALGWTIFELPIEITGGGVPGIIVRYHFGLEIQHKDHLCLYFDDTGSSNHPESCELL